MQMSKTIPSGANWCQQIPGKQIFTRLAYLKAKSFIFPIKYTHDYEMF